MQVALKLVALAVLMGCGGGAGDSDGAKAICGAIAIGCAGCSGGAGGDIVVVQVTVVVVVLFLLMQVLVVLPKGVVAVPMLLELVLHHLYHARGTNGSGAGVTGGSCGGGVTGI